MEDQADFLEDEVFDVLFDEVIHLVGADGTNIRVGSGRIGTGDLTLGELLVSAFSEANNMKSSLPEEVIPNYDKLLADSQQFINWLILGDTGGSPVAFSGRAISLSNILLQYGQYGSLEVVCGLASHISNS